MTHEKAPIDISTMPEVARLIHEVIRGGRPRVLREADTDLVIVTPIPSNRRRRPRNKITQADIEASLAAAGSWRGLLDPEQLKQDLDAARGDSSLPVRL